MKSQKLREKKNPITDMHALNEIPIKQTCEQHSTTQKMNRALTFAWYNEIAPSNT